MWVDGPERHGAESCSVPKASSMAHCGTRPLADLRTPGGSPPVGMEEPLGTEEPLGAPKSGGGGFSRQLESGRNSVPLVVACRHHEKWLTQSIKAQGDNNGHIP
jgi:hypothetical protein